MDEDFIDLAAWEARDDELMCLDSLFEGYGSCEEEEFGIELPDRDYSLDSPLIKDGADSMLEGLKNGVVTVELMHSKLAQRPHDVLSKNSTIDFSLFDGSDGFHSWVAGAIFQGDPCTNESQPWIDSINKTDAIALGIAEAFFMKISGGGFSISILSQLKMVEGMSDPKCRIRMDLEWFILLHMVVCIMNSKSPEARESLQKFASFPVKAKEYDDGSFACVIKHPGVGNIVVTQGFVSFTDRKRIFDSNMTLMVKDALIARFASKVNLVGRTDKKLENSVIKLEKLYEMGDKLMQLFGQDAFKVLKLIEPHCNEVWSKIGHAKRARLVKDNKLADHLDREIAGLDEMRRFESFCDKDKEAKIDKDYAKLMRGELIQVLADQFHRNKTWALHVSEMSKDDPLIRENSWPPNHVRKDYGSKWADLPIRQCHEIPEDLDPSVLYADKSHSMDYSHVHAHVASWARRPIPSKKVLETVLEKEDVNVRKFLRYLNDKGFDKEDLCIGLKAKERELKILGRFFTLMTWILRLYFIITEQLIKEFFLPLFQGLTMADDMQKVIRKMIDSTSGQGRPENDYSVVTYAIHVDYSKWNNHQRLSSNEPVFRANFSGCLRYSR